MENLTVPMRPSDVTPEIPISSKMFDFFSQFISLESKTDPKICFTVLAVSRLHEFLMNYPKRGERLNLDYSLKCVGFKPRSLWPLFEDTKPTGLPLFGGNLGTPQNLEPLDLAKLDFYDDNEKRDPDTKNQILFVKIAGEISLHDFSVVKFFNKRGVVEYHIMQSYCNTGQGVHWGYSAKNYKFGSFFREDDENFWRCYPRLGNSNDYETEQKLAKLKKINNFLKTTPYRKPLLKNLSSDKFGEPCLQSFFDDLKRLVSASRGAVKYTAKEEAPLPGCCDACITSNLVYLGGRPGETSGETQRGRRRREDETQEKMYYLDYGKNCLVWICLHGGKLLRYAFSPDWTTKHLRKIDVIIGC